MTTTPRTTRYLPLARSAFLLMALALVALPTALASPTVTHTFEGIPDSTPVGSTYAGFTYSNTNAWCTSTLYYPPSSGSCRVYTPERSTPATVTIDPTLVYDSVSFTYSAASTTFDVRIYGRDNSLLATQTCAYNGMGTFAHCSVALPGFEIGRFEADLTTQATIDDLTFSMLMAPSPPPATPAPELSSILLVGAGVGLVGMVALRRRG